MLFAEKVFSIRLLCIIELAQTTQKKARIKKDIAKGEAKAGISAELNIRALAAYEQARRALRGVCEPVFKMRAF